MNIISFLLLIWLKISIGLFPKVLRLLTDEGYLTEFFGIILSFDLSDYENKHKINERFRVFRCETKG
jgi:hypothetical protein